MMTKEDIINLIPDDELLVEHEISFGNRVVLPGAKARVEYSASKILSAGQSSDYANFFVVIKVAEFYMIRECVSSSVLEKHFSLIK